MLPSIGDIYCVYSDKMQSYTACQIIDLRISESSDETILASVLELDWCGKEIPHEHEWQHMKPLVCDFYFWNQKLDHSYVDADVPSNYIYVGTMPPLTDEQTNSYSGGWNVGDSLYRQRSWEQIDPTARQRFKQAAADRGDIQLAGQTIRRNCSKVDDSLLQHLDHWSQLEQLPCLTEIQTSHGDEQLLDYLRSNPFIHRLVIEDCTIPVLDLTGTAVRNLSVTAVNMNTLRLNTPIEQLYLNIKQTALLEIEAPADGRDLILYASTVADSGEVVPFSGLSRLRSLSLYHVRTLHIAELAKRFPDLHRLSVWGAPGNVQHMEHLVQLEQLHSLRMNDMFNFTSEQFPDPDEWSSIRVLDMVSLPAEAAKEIKKKYKKRAAAGMHIHIKRPRKPEWLAENLNNPFRDWDGREGLTTTQAKKAAKAYNTLHAAIRKLDHADEQSLLPLVEQYTKAFNAMQNSRSGYLETVEREEVYMALVSLLDLVDQQRAANDRERLLRDSLYDVFDQVRDF
ncbi:hypothetical protein ACE3MZ_13785 [Paenibacillus sp. WLX1005]|uniref:hypothetical protein n=1 Tax=Paenibacillus sp. WLX1005 TaxID=3243766 RepID=UPI003984069D